MITLKEAYEIVDKKEEKNNEKIIEFLENASQKKIIKLMKKINNPYFIKHIKCLDTKVECLRIINIDNFEDILFDLLKEENPNTIWKFSCTINEKGDYISFINRFNDEKKLCFLKFFTSIDEIERVLNSINDDSFIEEVLINHNKYINASFFSHNMLFNIIRCINDDLLKEKYLDELQGHNLIEIIKSFKDDRLKIKYINKAISDNERKEIFLSINNLEVLDSVIRKITNFSDKYKVLEYFRGTNKYDFIKGIIDDQRFIKVNDKEKVISIAYLKTLNNTDLKMVEKNEIIDYLLRNDDYTNYSIIIRLEDPSLLKYIRNLELRLVLIKEMHINGKIKSSLLFKEIINIEKDEEKLKYIDMLRFNTKMLAYAAASLKNDIYKLDLFKFLYDRKCLLILFNSIKTDEVKMRMIDNISSEVKYSLICELEDDANKKRYLKEDGHEELDKCIIATFKDDYDKMEYINDEKYTDQALYIIASLKNEYLIAMSLRNYQDSKYSQARIISNIKNPFTKKMLRLYIKNN